MSDAAAVDLALLSVRVALGAVMLAHGINHIVGGGRIAGTAGWFASLGMHPGRFHAWLASLTEVVAGALLVVGFATSLAAGAVIGVMAVAGVIHHRGNGFFTFRPGEGWEYVMVLAVTSLGVATTGAGGWSLDGAADLDLFAGASGLLLALVVGVGGAATLLAGFWRPGREADDGS